MNQACTKHALCVLLPALFLTPGIVMSQFVPVFSPVPPAQWGLHNGAFPNSGVGPHVGINTQLSPLFPFNFGIRAALHIQDYPRQTVAGPGSGFFPAVEAETKLSMLFPIMSTSPTIHSSFSRLIESTTSNRSAVAVTGDGIVIMESDLTTSTVTQNIIITNRTGGNVLFAFSTTNNVDDITKVIIDRNGRVGICTTTPCVKLDVNGGIRVGYTTASKACVLRCTNGQLQMYTGTTWATFCTNCNAQGGGGGHWVLLPGNRLTTTSSVGIGIAPTVPLHVNGNAIINGTLTTACVSTATFLGGNATAANVTVSNDLGVNNNASISGQLSVGQTLTAADIAAAGNLGAGGNFNLGGSFRPGGFAGSPGDVLISTGFGGPPAWMPFAPWMLNGNSGTNPANDFVGTVDNAGLAFRTNNTERMRIGSGGNVGIGTAMPLLTLDVNGGMRLGFTNTAQAGALRYNSGLLQLYNGTQWLTLGTTTATPSAGAGAWSVGNGVVSTTSKVGIGTSAPGVSLDVRGGIRVGFTTATQNCVLRCTNGQLQLYSGTAWENVLTGTLPNSWNVGGNAAPGGGLGTSDASDLHIISNGVNRITLNAAGNTEFQHNVDINGELNIDDALTAGGSAGTAGQVLVSQGAGNAPQWQNNPAAGWSLSGNAGTVPGTGIGQNYLGTADAQDLVVATNGAERMRIAAGGDIGIGTAAPAARLHGTGGSVLWTGTSGATPASGAGTRLMWIPAEGALRAGTVGATEWDAVNIGSNSAAFNNNTLASGDNSAAFGLDTRAFGDGSFAANDNNRATGINAAAFGEDTEAFGRTSCSFNNDTEAFGNHSAAFNDKTLAFGVASAAFGLFTDAHGTNSMATGNNTLASGTNSFSGGFSSEATNTNAVAFGDVTEASGLNSAAFNDGTTASGSNSFAIGDASLAGGNTSFAGGAFTQSTQSYTFSFGVDAKATAIEGMALGRWIDATAQNSVVIGKGVSSTTRLNNNISNSLMVGFNVSTPTLFVGGANARVGINRSNPSYDLHLQNNSAAKPSSSNWTVFSDRRLKTDIAPFTDGLDILRRIEPISYRYNGKAHMPTEETAIGIIAQDMQSIAPYTVKPVYARMNPEDAAETELLGFDGHALQYITINAVKEMDRQVTELTTALAAHKAANAVLKAELEEQKLIVSQLLSSVTQMQEALNVCCEYYQRTKQNETNESQAGPGADEARLGQNDPNPFSGFTTIDFYLPPAVKHAELVISEASSGKAVLSIPLEARGNASVQINARDLQSGAYLYRLVADGNVAGIAKMAVTK